MKKDGAEPIKSIVREVLESLKDKKLNKHDALQKAWQKAIGQKAEKHTRISSLRGGRLVIEVDESGWMYQLTLKKQEILKKLQKYLKETEIQELHFRIGDSGKASYNAH